MVYLLWLPKHLHDWPVDPKRHGLGPRNLLGYKRAEIFHEFCFSLVQMNILYIGWEQEARAPKSWHTDAWHSMNCWLSKSLRHHPRPHGRDTSGTQKTALLHHPNPQGQSISWGIKNLNEIEVQLSYIFFATDYPDLAISTKKSRLVPWENHCQVHVIFMDPDCINSRLQNPDPYRWGLWFLNGKTQE